VPNFNFKPLLAAASAASSQSLHLTNTTPNANPNSNNNNNDHHNHHHHQQQSRLESPKIKLYALLLDYYKIIDEINQLKLSSGAQNNVKPLYSKNLNKQMTINNSYNSNNNNEIAEMGNRSSSSNSHLVDTQLNLLAKQRDEAQTIIWSYINATYKPRMVDVVSGELLFDPTTISFTYPLILFCILNKACLLSKTKTTCHATAL
jgi:hypothetical protein